MTTGNSGFIVREADPSACDIIEGRTSKNRYISIRAPFVKASTQELLSQAELADILMSSGTFPATSQFTEKACVGCKACMPLRVPLETYQPNNEQRRIIRKNSALKLNVLADAHYVFVNPGFDGDEHAALYGAYHSARFPKAGVIDRHMMLNDLLTSPKLPMHLLELRDENNRLAGAIFGIAGKRTAYASMFYYDLNRREDGIGHYLVMKLVEHFKERDFSHLYLGHWTNEPSTYSYKAKFRPCEIMVNNCWELVDSEGIRALRVGAAYPPKRTI